MKNRAFGGIVATLGGAMALAWSASANAQAFMADPNIANGQGYRAGDFDIHPGLAAEVGYQSNYLLRSDKNDVRYVNAAPNAPPEGTGMLRVTPSISLQTTPVAASADAPGAERPPVTFGAGASGTYMEFFSSSLSNQRNMSGNATANLGILPGRAWSASINAGWTRSIQPTVLGDPDQSYNNDSVVLGADLAAQPNEGTLDWHFGYRFQGIIFEQSSGTPYNNVTHTGYTRGRWRFRPRTFLLYDGSISTRSYGDASTAVFNEHTQTPMRARIGLQSLISPRVSVLGLIGYGATFTSGASNDVTVTQYDSIIGQAEIAFYPTQAQQSAVPVRPGEVSHQSLLVTSIALGYNRDFVASYTGTSYGLDRGYLRAEYFYAGRFLVKLEGGVGAYEYPDLYFASSAGINPATKQPFLMANSYTDIRADATLFTEYRVLPSIGINATLTYMENFSSTMLPASVGDLQKTFANGGNFYDLSWRNYTAFLGVRWLM